MFGLMSPSYGANMHITAMLVDDERPALKIMEILLKKYSQIEVVGQFINPVKALEEIRIAKPDVVFLDIDMPYINGMEAASSISEFSPNTEVIFVTAYEKYALEAYKFHPMDYILKPVEEERLDELIPYLLRKHHKLHKAEDKKLIIRCFGDLCIQWENEEPIKFRTKKTKELFAFLVHNNNCKITKEEIIESLWQDLSPDKAIKQFYNAIYYIRKALSDYGVTNNQILIDNTYSLAIKNADFDVERLKILSQNIEDNLEAIEKILSTQYLEKQDYPWADIYREEYYMMHQKYLIRLAAAYEENMEYEKEEKLLQKAMREDSLNEAAANMLIKLYLLTKNKINGIRFFKTYTKDIKEELAEEPCKNILDCYNKLKRL